MISLFKRHQSYSLEDVSSYVDELKKVVDMFERSEKRGDLDLVDDLTRTLHVMNEVLQHMTENLDVSQDVAGGLYGRNQTGE